MEKRDEQAIDAVRLYFEQGLSQAQVAQTMGISRPTVAKLLQRGKQAGFVTVEIHDPRETSSELAARIEQRFGLLEARVVHTLGDDAQTLFDDLGRVGAEVVESLVKDGMKVGVSWGKTMQAIARSLHRTVRRDVEIIQLKGGTSHSTLATHDFEIMRAFCDAFNAEPRYLPLPVIFDDVRTLQIVESDPHIASILDAQRATDLVVFTVGALARESLTLNLGNLSDREASLLLDRAVGDACSRFFTASGEIALEEVDARTVGISLADLASRPLRVLVAGGPAKAAALATALNIGLATHLVVDQDLALALVGRACEDECCPPA